MTDPDDEIPPGHTRKPNRPIDLEPTKIDWSWPRLTRIEIVVLAILAVLAFVFALWAEQPEVDIWFLTALGVGAYAEARRARVPQVNESDIISTLLKLIERAFSATFAVVICALPGLFFGTRLREYFSLSQPVTG